MKLGNGERGGWRRFTALGDMRIPLCTSWRLSLVVGCNRQFKVKTQYPIGDLTFSNIYPISVTFQ